MQSIQSFYKHSYVFLGLLFIHLYLLSIHLYFIIKKIINKIIDFSLFDHDF